MLCGRCVNQISKIMTSEGNNSPETPPTCLTQATISPSIAHLQQRYVLHKAMLKCYQTRLRLHITKYFGDVDTQSCPESLSLPPSPLSMGAQRLQIFASTFFFLLQYT